MQDSFRDFVSADLPDGTKQRLCVVSRDEWFVDDSPFWKFARSAVSDGWIWVVSANFAVAPVQVVLMYLPEAAAKPPYRMIWEEHEGRGGFRLESTDDVDS
ncbi:MAG TPA: hypothetical protein VGX96_01365 [Candidatus Elarobacter sp.]|nr:hypothetical protein [Candidatus Elarobacter sp.]